MKHPGSPPARRKIPFPHSLPLLTQQLCSVPNLSPRLEDVSGRADPSDSDLPATDAHCWKAPAMLWQIQQERSEPVGRQGGQTAALPLPPFSRTWFNHLQHSQGCTSSCTPRETWESGIPQENHVFTTDFLPQLEPSPSKALILLQPSGRAGDKPVCLFLQWNSLNSLPFLCTGVKNVIAIIPLN